ncbi:MAG: DUF2339 domain-containing protein [Gaiellales bacterium]
MTVLDERLRQAESRLDELEHDVAAAKAEVAAIRSAATPTAQEEPAIVAAEPVRPVEPASPPPASSKSLVGCDSRASRQTAAEPDQRGSRLGLPQRASLRDQLPSLDLFGARTLSVLGGAVMLLGVAFLFALAVNRGWIGPEARVGIGAVVSGLCVAAGIVARRRLGDVYAAQAVVGVGIAGGFLTLLAATALYELIGYGAGLGGAVAVAAVATLVAWRWSSEVIAGLGLIGALLAPFAPAYADRPTATGVAFAVAMFLGAVAIAVARRWDILLGGAASVVVLQLLLLGADGVDDRASLASILVGGGALLAAGVARIRLATVAVDPLPLSLAVASGGIVTTSLLELMATSTERGLALLGFAILPALAGLAMRRRSPLFAEACAGAALIASCVGTADLLSGGGLTVAWGIQAAALAWVGRRGARLRLQLVAVLYLGLALANALAIERLGETLFADGQLLHHVPSALALAVAGGVFAVAASPGLAQFAGVAARQLQLGFAAFGVVAALYAAGLTLVAASATAGQLATTILWSLTGLIVAVWAARREDLLVALSGLGWLAVVDAKALGFDLGLLDRGLGTASVTVVALAVLTGGVALRRLSVSPLPLGIAGGLAAVCAGVGLAIAAVEASDPDGFFGEGYDDSSRAVLLLWLGAVVVLYAALTVTCLRSPRCRSVATALWLVGLPFALWFEAVAIDNVYVVAGFLVTAAALAVAGRWVDEPRLVWTGAGLLGATTLYVLAEQTPLARFAEASLEPADGLWAPLTATLATAVVAWAWPLLRPLLVAAVGALGLYALSLGVLGVVTGVSTASVETDFQRGHMFVTAIWAVLGLVLLAAGLVRRSTPARLVGLGLFGVSLAKLFLFDLSTLSSMTRSAAFLAVGAMLVAGGALVQRLSGRNGDEDDDRDAREARLEPRPPSRVAGGR